MKNVCAAAVTAVVVSSIATTSIAAASSLHGYASYYMTGKRTANGERFNPFGMTAAHRSLPFGTKVKVTNTRNGRTVVVRINDRGPFIMSRVIDLSLGAARAVGLAQPGVAQVQILVLN